MSSLKTTLAKVSRNCLRGQPVPDDLQKLWKAQLNDDAEVLEQIELELVDTLDDDFFDGYDENSGAPAYSVRSYQRMIEQIAFFAKTMDGGLLGYWLGEKNRPVAEAPLVELDSEGQFELRGMSVAEYILQWTSLDEPEEFAEFREWLEEHGIEVIVKNHEDIWKKLKKYEDPNKQSGRYQEEEQAKGQ
jgi:hypothetical protein